MSINKNLRLGFYYHIPALQDGENVFVPGFLGRFLNSLAGHCDHLTCFFHEAISPGNRSLCDYHLNATNITWVNLGLPRSSVIRSFFPHAIIKKFDIHRDQLDAILIRGPSPLLPSLVHAVKELPFALLLVGDYQEGLIDLHQPVWRKFLIRLWVGWYTQQQLKAASNSLTFVNSHKLYKKFESTVCNLHEIRTTTLEADDFFERSDTCLHRPIHLLYTGRYSASKGLFDIIDAMVLLAEKGDEIVLDLVGWPENGEENIVNQLKYLAKEKGIPDKVIDHGYQPVGPDLFYFYRMADIYILASRSSFEGFPRTIWEAMAHSLPVIATRVGSIPDFIEGASELVEPGQPIALAVAVNKLIHSPELRQMYISRGYAIARSNTLELQVGKMTDTMRSWLEK